jgi:hypothetical protein
MHNPIAAALALLSFGGAVALAAPAPAGAQSGALQRTDDAQALSEYERSAVEPGAYAEAGRSQRGPSVRVWMENDRDLFSPGALTRVYVRPSQDAYVAVVHVTPDGDVEFLWPRSYDDDGYLQGDRAYALSSGSAGSRYVRLGYGYGIGYVFAVSSDEPLDLRRVRDYYYRRTSGWDRDLNVVGDPFHAMERFARDLVPGYEDGYGALDWYSYHVGSSRYRYPRYACYDSYGPWYTSRSPYYDGCDRIRVLLVEAPYYYDTRYYRGDRSLYWRRWYATDYNNYYARRREPQHGYKEGVASSSRGGRGSPNSRPMGRGDDVPPARGGTGSSGGSTRYGGGRGDDAQEPRVTQPSRTRPTLQRRPPESEPIRAQPRGGDGDEPRAREPRSSEPRVREAPAERREPPARSSEPRRESPPPRSAEPRRESPPPRSDGGTRSAPSESPRVRPSRG